MQNMIGIVPTKYYCDLLFDSSSKLTIRKSFGDESVFQNLKNRGLVFRIFDGRKFHEISTSLSEISLLKEKIQRLILRIDYDPQINLITSPPKTIASTFNQPNFQDFTQVELQHKLDKISKFYSIMESSDNSIINPEINYFDNILERIYVNSEGSVMRQTIPRVGINFRPMVKIENKIDYDSLTINGVGGLEILKKINQETLTQLVISSKELCEAPSPPHGVLPVILGPTIAGAMAHAIFGHGVQADQILRGRSMLENYYQEQVASEIVSISDCATEINQYGSYSFDDEGIIPQKTIIVKDGILSNYIHSRFTASVLDQPEQLKGNGRRQDFQHPLYPRNSNTFFERGDHNLEEMISDIKLGVLVHNLDFGMEDLINGTIQINSRSGYLIENGEKTKRLKSVALTGDSLEYLKSISAISKHPMHFLGYESRKGREDIVPVSFGGSYIKVDRAIIGSG
jgi:TldD protein